jgi:uncharacterized protein YbjT (DUF2867 family)
MKYAIIGGAGNTAKPIVEKLLDAGQQVTVIGRNPQHLQALVAKGAKAAIGSVDDIDFLTKAFAGADAVYTMVPPIPDAADWKTAIAQKGKIYAKAIADNNIKYVVNLSSIGADMPAGAGPVTGLHNVEKVLNTLIGVNILHLRPGYFFPNLLSNISLAKNMNIVGNNFGEPGFKLVLVAPGDIADVAAEELMMLNFTGQSVRYVAGDEKTGDEIAKVFGDAIGKPELPWVIFSDEQALDGMIKAGLPTEIAKNYAEMGHALHTGDMTKDYWKHRPESLQKTKLEDFAKTFADVYNMEQAQAPVHG